MSFGKIIYFQKKILAGYEGGGNMPFCLMSSL